MRCTRPRDEVYSIIWQRHIPSRVSFFLWRLLHGFLATDDALCSRGFHMVSRCVCGREDETLRHLFLDCPRTRHIWGHYQRFWGCESLVLCLPVRCFSSGDVVPPPGTIFGSFCLPSFCGKFGRPEMLTGSTRSLFLLMQLSFRLDPTLGLLVLLLVSSLPN